MHRFTYMHKGDLMVNYENFFKALSDVTRLRLLRLLVVNEKRICVCELVDALEMPQYRVSRHLNILKNAGLIDSQRDGTWMYYCSLERGSPFKQQLFNLLNHQMSEKLFLTDEEKLADRLKLRDGGRCVVGYANQKCKD